MSIILEVKWSDPGSNPSSAMWLWISHLSSPGLSFLVYKCGAELDQHFLKCVLWKIHSMKCSARKGPQRPNVWEMRLGVTGALLKALRILTENLAYLTQCFPVIFGNNPFSPIPIITLQLWLLSIQTGLSLNSLYFPISTTLSPLRPPKALFPAPQCFKLLSRRQAQCWLTLPWIVL